MEYNFKKLIDIRKLQELTDELYMESPIPSAIITIDGEVLTGSGWQKICTDFHRQHPQTLKECIKSDTIIRRKLDAGEPFAIYKCPRGLVDASSPVIIDGEHVANVFAGQIFLEPPDEATEQFFRKQAQEFGFDETEYIKAFKEIPIFTEKKFRAAVSFLAALAEMVAEMASERLNELKSLEVLRQSEEKYRTLFERESNAIFVYDPDTAFILDANEATSKMYGYGKDELIGMSCLKFSAEIKKSTSIIDKTCKDGEAEEAPYHLHRKKDGTILIVELNSFAVTLKGKKLMYAVIKDITARKQAEDALRKSEEKFRSAFQTSPDSINLNRASDGVYIDINDGFTKIMGYSREDVIGKSSLKLNIWDNSKDRDRLISGLQKNGVVENLEARFIGKDGQIKIGLMSARLLHIGNQDVILSITRNITQQRKLEIQLQQSQKMESIGTLAGGIAHDFNNILFPIVGHTEMLLEDVPEDSPLRDGLTHIYTGALRASELVKQILTFSRQETGEIKLMKMQPIIKEALKLIRSTTPATIEIKQDIKADCGAIKADPTQIHQVIINLTTNAYHAMEDDGGELMIGLKEIKLGELDLPYPNMIPGIYACLTIVDTGKGMDKALKEKIFDPFFTTKKIGKGTGMGLSIVHGIVESMKGAIQVYSEPGEGTQFHVYLPLEKSLPEKPETLQMKDSIQGGIERILLVDDEDAIITMEQMMLERLGYQVTSRTSSIEALEAFRDNPDKFDLVITDMAMPNMPGDKLAIELTKIQSDIPILLCSGFSEIMSEEEAASIGIRGFLWKPIVMKDLARKIRETLEQDKHVKNSDH